MKSFGVDASINNDSFCTNEMEIIGPYKAPIQRNVFYRLKNFELIHIVLLKDKMPWNK